MEPCEAVIPATSKATWFLKLFAAFVWTELLCCVFPIGIFATLALTRAIQIPGLPRYDFILLCCIVMQWAMIKSRLETVDELKVICLFHLIGLAMELYKTHLGAWSYPESAYTKLGTVPLYSGFMYASVASYMCQGWRRFDLELERMPAKWLMIALAVAIYVNFFTNHVLPDLRWILIPAVVIVFSRTVVRFSVANEKLQMPMWLSFLLMGFFVWVAENIGTYFSGWRYPLQAHAWEIVEIQKISSWALLVIVSFILVAWLKSVKHGLDVKSAS